MICKKLTSLLLLYTVWLKCSRPQPWETQLWFRTLISYIGMQRGGGGRWPELSRPPHTPTLLVFVESMHSWCAICMHGIPVAWRLVLVQITSMGIPNSLDKTSFLMYRFLNIFTNGKLGGGGGVEESTFNFVYWPKRKKILLLSTVLSNLKLNS
jgi:hypothetical protein